MREEEEFKDATMEDFILAFLCNKEAIKVEDLAKEMAIPEKSLIYFGWHLCEMYIHGMIDFKDNGKGWEVREHKQELFSIN